MMQPDEHERWSPLLPLYINGSLEDEDRERLASHMSKCPLCQRELAEWREIAQLARQPHPGERHLQSAQVSLTSLHQRLMSGDDAPTKEVHMQSSLPPTTPTSAPAERGRNVYAIALVAVLAVFVVTGFAVFHVRGSGQLSTPGASAKSTPTPTHPVTATPASAACAVTVTTNGKSGTFATTTGQAVTVHGITMTMNTFYAEFTRTIVLVDIRTSASLHSVYDANDMSITTADHAMLPAQMWGGGEPTSGSNGISDFAFFYPLPSRDLGSQQTVTLTVQQMKAVSGTQTQLLSGPWQLHITFTAVQPHATETLNCAPQTHQGISIQPFSVAQAPAPAQIDGYPGGIILGVCVTGTQEAGFGESYTTANYGSFSSGGALPPPQTQALLTLPNGTQVTPQYEIYPRTSCRIAGKQGQSYLLTYLVSPTVLTGKAVFTVPTILSYINQSTLAQGPWSFSFDLK
jgi:hypothetical protein